MGLPVSRLALLIGTLLAHGFSSTHCDDGFAPLNWPNPQGHRTGTPTFL